MQLLRENLAPDRQTPAADEILSRLSESISRDIEDLLAHLQPRAEECMKEAVEKLTSRGVTEAKELVRLLEDQRKRVQAELFATEGASQMELGLNDEEQKQRAADIRYWQTWLANVEGDLASEPDRIRELYTVKSHRIEPIGLVYLWPAKS
jgi:hypothetical protein